MACLKFSPPFGGLFDENVWISLKLRSCTARRILLRKIDHFESVVSFSYILHVCPFPLVFRVLESETCFSIRSREQLASTSTFNLGLDAPDGGCSPLALLWHYPGRTESFARICVCKTPNSFHFAHTSSSVHLLSLRGFWLFPPDHHFS